MQTSTIRRTARTTVVRTAAKMQAILLTHRTQAIKTAARMQATLLIQAMQAKIHRTAATKGWKPGIWQNRYQVFYPIA